jgi:hypothetical protein
MGIHKHYWIGVLIGFLGASIGNLIGNYEKNIIPKTSEVRAGYVIPNKLEIKVEDLDRSGEKETIMVYDGKQYLLRLDDKGRPTVQAYEVKPAQVVPAQIVPTTQP